jgi:hypothetical protein
MTSSDPRLEHTLAVALNELERDEEIVICTASPERVVRRLRDAALEVTPNTGLTSDELTGLRQLVLHAIADKRFFDWEMPTLTGFTAEAFREIAEKLPPP